MYMSLNIPSFFFVDSNKKKYDASPPNYVQRPPTGTMYLLYPKAGILFQRKQLLLGALV